MEDHNIPQKDYDFIILGTGLVESIVSCSLAKRGKRVLHFDQNDYYGELYVSGNLSNMMKYFDSDASPVAKFSLPDTVQGNFENGEWFRLPNKAANILLVPPSEPKDAATQTKQRQLLQIYQHYFSRYYPSNKKSSYLHPSFFHLLNKPNAASERLEDLPASSEFVHPAYYPLLQLKDDEAFLKLLIHADRYFNIDLTPKMIYCSGQLINAIVSSNIHHYLEFKPLNSLYYFLSSESKGGSTSPYQLWKVPSNKNDIFMSTHLTALEKRILMKFYQFIFDWAKLQKGANLQLFNENELMAGRALYRPQNKSIAVETAANLPENLMSTTSTTEEEEDKKQRKGPSASYLTSKKPDILYNQTNFKEKTFLEFLQAFKLSEKLQWIIVYALCLHYSAAKPTTTTTTTSPSSKEMVEEETVRTVLAKPIHDCLIDLSLYFNSIGIFGEMAYLAPLYGISETVQGFCRMSAVWGSTFMLRQTITEMKLEEVLVPALEKEVPNIEATDAAAVMKEPKGDEEEVEKEEEGKEDSVQAIAPPSEAKRVVVKIKDSEGQEYTCSQLICNGSYLSEEIPSDALFSYHLIAIFAPQTTTITAAEATAASSESSSMLASFFPEERSIGMIPPLFQYSHPTTGEKQSLNNPYTVYLHQYDHSTETTPEGMTMLHIHTIIQDNNEDTADQSEGCLSNWEERGKRQLPIAQELTQRLVELVAGRDQVSFIDWSPGGESSIASAFAAMTATATSSATAAAGAIAPVKNGCSIAFSRAFLRPVMPLMWKYHPAFEERVLLTTSLEASSLHVEKEVELAKQIVYELLTAKEERSEASFEAFQLFEEERKPGEDENAVPTGSGAVESEEDEDALEYKQIYEKMVASGAFEKSLPTENDASPTEEKEKMKEDL